MSFLPPGALSSSSGRSFLLESSSPDEAGALSVGLRGRGRSRLPIWTKKDELLYAIYRHRVSIVVGSTGCGKSTQIPQWLDECGYTKNGYKVLLVVPRRITCVSVASRIQQEIGSPGVVGWQIRFERNVDEARNRIMVVTDGMALAYMLGDPLFTQYSVIMLDDFHERSTQLDLLLSLLVTRIMPKRPKLRLIISSATLDALSVQKFVMKHLGKKSEAAGRPEPKRPRRKSKWDFEIPSDKETILDLTDVGEGDQLDTVVTMSVEGRCYPVTTHYLTEACANYVATAVETVVRIHTSEEVPPYGADILVFLTGQEEIDAAVKLTKERITDYNRPSGGGPLVTFALHSGLPVGLQLEALKPVSRGSRKVVYSTNVAESGVTIPNVGYVVDTGFVKQALATVPNHHTLLVTPCSKEQLVQRAGRAGRVCPGICYRLFSKSSLGAFPDKTLPEITRTPSLSSVLLQIISLGVRNVCSLQWLTPPSARAMEAALEELRVLGFIDDKGIIADKRAAELLPLSPAQARLLLLSVDYGCSLEAVQLAALMSIDSIWARPHSRSTRERLAACKRSLGVHEGDMLTMINVYREWRENETSPDGDTDWAHRHMVHVGSMSRAAKIASVVRRQLCQVLIDSGMDAAKAQSKVDESCGDDIEPLCRCICGAFAANAASQVNSSGRYVSLRDRRRQLVIGQQSVLYGVQRPPNYVVYSHGVDTGSNNGAYEMIHISQIDSQWLVDVAPTLYRPVKRSSRPLPMISRWPAADEAMSPKAEACFDCVVFDKLMRRAWTGCVLQTNMVDHITWDKDTVTRLREVIKSGDRVELERSGEVVLLSAAAQLTVGKLSLIRDVKLESSSEDAMSKLTRWAIPKACGGKVPPNELSQKGNEVRHTSIGVALKVQGEQDVGKFCHEVEQVLARLRQKNSALRQECIQTLGHEMYISLINEVPLPEVTDDEVNQEWQTSY